MSVVMSIAFSLTRFTQNMPKPAACSHSTAPSAAKAKPIIICTIDGGGSRGIIPVVILNEISCALGTHPDAVFDFIYGTSIGIHLWSACCLRMYMSGSVIATCIRARMPMMELAGVLIIDCAAD